MLIFGEDIGDYCPSSEQKCPAAQPDAEEVAKGHWEEWSFWSPCTASCGHTGIQLRSRTCSGANHCEGEPSSESQPCNRRILCPTTSSDDAQWSEWTPWSQCSVSCGRGSQARYRRCTTPQNAVAFTCSGQTMDLRNCEELPCVATTEQRRHYGQWTEWSAWSTCSSSCGPGSTVRMRACSQEPCEGASQQKLSCNLMECATWSQWGAWSDCSLLCGKGMRSRSRTCPAGSTCPGTGVEQQPCNEQPCDQSADSQMGLMWSDWSAWGPCSVSCGNGVRRRTRACHRENCAGSYFESAICNEAECAVSDALWGGWGYWSPCSESCGFGVRRRVRKCYGSGKCPGNEVQGEQCAGGDLHKCPWRT